jgi:hypothetical protein
VSEGHQHQRNVLPDDTFEMVFTVKESKYKQLLNQHERWIILNKMKKAKWTFRISPLRFSCFRSGNQEYINIMLSYNRNQRLVFFFFSFLTSSHETCVCCYSEATGGRSYFKWCLFFLDRNEKRKRCRKKRIIVNRDYH